MAQRLAVIGFLLAVVIAAFAFFQWQQAVKQANTAATAQADAETQSGTAVAQAQVASQAQMQAESNQATAVQQAEQASTAQAEAQASASAAAAQAELAGTALSNGQATAALEITHAASTVTANANVIATQQAQAESQAATANAQLEAAATDEVILLSALGTATAQIDLAQFAASAAEDDRTTALTLARGAQTQVAQLQAEVATAQSQLTGLPAAPAPPTPTAPAQPEATATVQPEATSATQPEATAATGSTELTQQFTSQDGSIQFNYPAGWFASETNQGSIIIATSRDVTTRTANLLTTGQVSATLLVLPGNGLTGKASGTNAGEVVQALVTTVTGQNSPIQMQNPSEFKIGDQSAARAEGTDGQNDLLILVIDAGNDLFGVLLGQTANGERDQFEPTLRAILGSFQIKTAS